MSSRAALNQTAFGSTVDPASNWANGPGYSTNDLPELEKIWQQVATNFASYPTDMVVFEILNEPHDGANVSNITATILAAIGSTVLDSKVVNATNTWYEFNVTAAITNNGTFTLVLTTTGTGLTEFFSRDADWLSGPDLTVTTAVPFDYNQMGLGVLGGGLVQLIYRGIAGESYALDWRTNLGAGNWIAVLTNQAAGDGYVFFTNKPNSSANYFRTRKLP